LLFNFLGELIYYKDSEQLLLQAGSDLEKNGLQQLSVVKERCSTPIDAVDVKAVTLHRFQLEKTNDGWTAMVILDI